MIAQRVRLRGVQQGFSLCHFAHDPPQMTDQKAGRGEGGRDLG